MQRRRYAVVVIGGGHAGVEAAWAAANLCAAAGLPAGSVGLVTIDPAKIGEMSCNPAIGGLAKGQLVREIDALGGLMGLVADATGIQFKMLNTSKGPAVWGPRCQSDKHAYAEAVRAMVASRPEIEIVGGTVERLVVARGGGADQRITGVGVRTADGDVTIGAEAVVLTTGTFMRGLMHTGETQTPGGRHGEGPATGISGMLRDLGFELGRLKTGTPPRLRRGSLDWDALPAADGDDRPTPFSELSGLDGLGLPIRTAPFPAMEQVACRQTHTTSAGHEVIRANLDRAPMFTGQIESVGPRYCPSIEDKVVRFADREQHGVFLEPEGLETDWVYCNGIASSLPADVQDVVVRTMPGCERAEILRHGYAVEYDMVRPHQIFASGETKLVRGLYLAGQINGTSGYEEAAAQGLVAGINAARRAIGGAGEAEFVLGRDEAYIGVLMDDLVTKTPVEPYRMFTSRAEHRLLLRSDNAPERLTPIAERLGLLGGTELGAARRRAFAERRAQLDDLHARIDRATVGGEPLSRVLLRGSFGADELRRAVGAFDGPDAVVFSVLADRRYEPYLVRQRAEIRRQAAIEHRRLPAGVDFAAIVGLRAEAAASLSKFRPATFGQAGRLEGVTPADLSLLAVQFGARQRAGRARRRQHEAGSEVVAKELGFAE